MDESHLLRAAFLFSFLGIAVLYLVSRNIEINDTTVEKINREELQGQVKVTGEISRVTSRENVIFLEISEMNTLQAVVFNPGNISLEEGMAVELTGEIEEGRTGKQLVVDRIIPVRTSRS